MGSGTSRGKRVTPACVSEVNVTKTTVGVTPSVQERRSFKPLEVGAILRNARNRAQPDRHSDGHDSDFSGEDDGGMDTFLTDREDRERSAVKTNHAKKTVIRSKTYGLCHRGEEEEEVSSAPRLRTEEASGPNEASRSRDAFTGACPGQRNVRTFKLYRLMIDVGKHKVYLVVFKRFIVNHQKQGANSNSNESTAKPHDTLSLLSGPPLRAFWQVELCWKFFPRQQNNRHLAAAIAPVSPCQCMMDQKKR
ncbi:uncharacterized protein LOC120833384 isoform X1 [Gasterosteus aculeatus]